MLIECEGCEVRGSACGDCVVTAVLGVSPAQPVDLDDRELAALGLLADVGMVAPLRHRRSNRCAS